MAMQEPLVVSARTVEEAIDLALKELDVDRDAAEVEVLSRGKAGFLGIGAELARVRVTLESNARTVPLKSETGSRPRRLATAAVGQILLESAGVT
ncbi:hypothetical protein GBAR_LOCUS18844 [Geodia barretti]|uniref:RNA-binding protein KhpB N-terminal domain-containing protein n=1 Tax=Geodia barretti TaxID=519541 RepID=A0AA35SQH8_GEOBA|nr:hypothetical protein GBAR_LOCUS18844 [Geodia barretti]